MDAARARGGADAAGPSGTHAFAAAGEGAFDAAGAVARGPSVRVRVGVGAAVVLVVLALVCSVLVTAFSPVGVTTTLGPAAASGATEPGASAVPQRSTDAPPGSGAPPAPTTGAAVLVHVLGAVVAPGVYELAEGARVFDAVAAAGGFTEQADQASINLARPLVDGEQLRVLAVGETPPPPGSGAGGPGAVGAGAAGSGGAGSGGAASEGTGGGAAAGAAGAGTGGAAAGAVINLNSATELDLDALPRIGPAMAARIIAWRTANGPFTAVDDLLQVTGIGEKTLESLRPLVTV